MEREGRARARVSLMYCEYPVTPPIVLDMGWGAIPLGRALPPWLSGHLLRLSEPRREGTRCRASVAPKRGCW